MVSFLSQLQTRTFKVTIHWGRKVGQGWWTVAPAAAAPGESPFRGGLPHPLLSFLPIQGHWTCWSAAASGGPPLLPVSLPRLCLAYARAQPGPWAGSSGGGTAPGGRPGLHVSAPPPPTSSHGGPKEARRASCLPWRPRDQAPWAVSDETSRRITAEGAGWEAGG